jgi:ADP-ribose pyrophosphatase YjhB (NUDIX family)
MDRSSVLDRQRRDRRPGRKRRMTTPGGQPSAPSPTHAGGVVVRRDGPLLRYLVVTSNTESGSWVLPKGRIEEGEEPSEAARREALDVLEFVGRRGFVRAQYFLMEFVSDGAPCEDRDQKWLPLAEALEALPYPQTQELILKADALAKR